jgi:hypothetical protein
MIADLTGSERFKEYVKAKGSKPAIIIGIVRNKTSEHIDADNYIKKLEAAIFNANIATLVESDEFRDKLRVERAQQQEFADPKTVKQWGMETGADLILFGEMTSETDVYNKERVVTTLPPYSSPIWKPTSASGMDNRRSRSISKTNVRCARCCVQERS